MNDPTPSKNPANTLRAFDFILDFTPHALTSVLVSFGQTRIITAVSVSEDLPAWLRHKKGKTGWLTAEYNLLPSSTHIRYRRERGILPGRTQEIQRLISRSLRGALDLTLMPDITLTVDCDVISADGGTRTTAINGGMYALIVAVSRLMARGKLTQNPVKELIASTSVALHDGGLHLDPHYTADANADADINVVLTSSRNIVEIQGCAEKRSFSPQTLQTVIQTASDSLEPVFTTLTHLQHEHQTSTPKSLS